MRLRGSTPAPSWPIALSCVSFLRLHLGLFVRGLALAVAATLARVVREELVDQALQHNGGLSLTLASPFLEVAVEPSGADADVLAAEQPLRLDAGEAVVGNLVVLGVDAQVEYGLVVLGIKADARDLAHAHPRHGHRGAHLEVADVVELGAHVIARFHTAELHTVRRQLRGQKQQRGETEQHKQAGSDLERSIGTHGFKSPVTGTPQSTHSPAAA